MIVWRALKGWKGLIMSKKSDNKNYSKIILDNYGKKELLFFKMASKEFKNAYYGHVNTYYNKSTRRTMKSPIDYFNYKIDKDDMLSFAEIGEKLGIHQEIVRITYYEAIKKIKKGFQKKGINLEYLRYI